MPKNVSFSPEILKKYENVGFEDFVAYLTTCPLRYDLADIVDSFLPHNVYEFNYTSTYRNDSVIIGTIRDGQHTVSISVNDVRRVLRLLVKDEYLPTPFSEECHIILKN
ncbi:unnamed protein product [Lactuca virosa]|uniref:Uncharacterized protein n=1 Tax=Lactuca virosa TaxID=75947 RepID=A0AAU9PME1_9ASTR|nr:unnamed protein product [Lactuca virosa]